MADVGCAEVRTLNLGMTAGKRCLKGTCSCSQDIHILLEKYNNSNNEILNLQLMELWFHELWNLHVLEFGGIYFMVTDQATGLELMEPLLI